MKYNEGDKVKIKEDLELHKTYDGIVFIKEMAKLKGKIVTIGMAGTDDDYMILENGFFYSEEMLEPADMNSEYSNADILKSLNIIKDICSRTEDCLNCRLSNNGYCFITEVSPNEWQINNEQKINFFK